MTVDATSKAWAELLVTTIAICSVNALVIYKLVPDTFILADIAVIILGGLLQSKVFGSRLFNFEFRMYGLSHKSWALVLGGSYSEVKQVVPLTKRLSQSIDLVFAFLAAVLYFSIAYIFIQYVAVIHLIVSLFICLSFFMNLLWVPVFLSTATVLFVLLMKFSGLNFYVLLGGIFCCIQITFFQWLNARARHILLFGQHSRILEIINRKWLIPASLLSLIIAGFYAVTPENDFDQTKSKSTSDYSESLTGFVIKGKWRRPKNPSTLAKKGDSTHSQEGISSESRKGGQIARKSRSRPKVKNMDIKLPSNNVSQADVQALKDWADQVRKSDQNEGVRYRPTVNGKEVDDKFTQERLEQLINNYTQSEMGPEEFKIRSEQILKDLKKQPQFNSSSPKGDSQSVKDNSVVIDVPNGPLGQQDMREIRQKLKKAQDKRQRVQVETANGQRFNEAEIKKLKKILEKSEKKPTSKQKHYATQVQELTKKSEESSSRSRPYTLKKKPTQKPEQQERFSRSGVQTASDKGLKVSEPLTNKSERRQKQTSKTVDPQRERSWNKTAIYAVLLILFVSIILILRKKKKVDPRPEKPKVSRKVLREAAYHLHQEILNIQQRDIDFHIKVILLYNALLEYFAACGLSKSVHVTPDEYLSLLRDYVPSRIYSPFAVVTELFSDVFYGRKILSENQKTHFSAAVREIISVRI